MRIIKFRGRGVKGDFKGVWRYGDLSHYNLKRDGCLVIWDENNFYYSGIDVDPVTVGQFTGQHDKNGTEIYEGDIIQLADVCRCRVRWNEERGQYELAECGAESLFVDKLWMLNADRYEVIGNIYDNPELLTMN